MVHPVQEYGGRNPIHDREAPELRQPYAGLTLNHANDVEIKDNFVKTDSADDYAYVMDSGMTLGSTSGGNKNCKVFSVAMIKQNIMTDNVWQPCKVAAAGGTGYGKIDDGYGAAVTSATWAECTAVMDL